MLAARLASLSNGIGLLARQRETLIGAVSLVLLWLTFLSCGTHAAEPRPRLDHRILSKLNPVNWAVEAGRSAAMQKIDWGLVGSQSACSSPWSSSAPHSRPAPSAPTSTPPLNKHSTSSQSPATLYAAGGRSNKCPGPHLTVWRSPRTTSIGRRRRRRRRVRSRLPKTRRRRSRRRSGRRRVAGDLVVAGLAEDPVSPERPASCRRRRRRGVRRLHTRRRRSRRPRRRKLVLARCRRASPDRACRAGCRRWRAGSRSPCRRGGRLGGTGTTDSHSTRRSRVGASAST